MKTQAMNLFENMGKQIESILSNEATFLEAYNSSPDTKYRLEFFKAMQSLGVSNRVAARVATSVKVEVNQFDAEVCQIYVDKCFLPMLKAILNNKSKLDLEQHLSDEEVLVNYAEKCSLSYKV